jgi:hypothetical protein
MGLGLMLAMSGLATAENPPAPPTSGSTQAEIAQPAGDVATPIPAESAAPADAESKDVLTPKMQPQSVTVVLINGNTLVGTVAEADQWTMKTSFGSANLPLSAVAGVRMAQEGSATTTVVLHNGDTITGALELDQVVIQTEWGRAEIMGTHVASILFTPGLKWSSEAGLNGTRWKLVATDLSDSQAKTATAAQATGDTPQRRAEPNTYRTRRP